MHSNTSMLHRSTSKELMSQGEIRVGTAKQLSEKINHVSFHCMSSFYFTVAVRFKWPPVLSVFVVYLILKKNCISPMICLNTLTKDHLITCYHSVDMVAKHFRMISWLTCSTISTWLHVFFSPTHAWTPEGLSESHRQWKRLVHCVTTGVTDIKHYSFTAHPDTQRNLDVWLIGTSFFPHFIFR